MRLPFLKSDQLQNQVEDLLVAHADALAAGYSERDLLLDHCDWVLRSQVEGLFDLAEQVAGSLVETLPSEQFVAGLRQALLAGGEMPARLWWVRIRQLPPRTQLAAGIGGAALTAGVFWLASRALPEALDLWRSRRTMAA